MELAQAETKAKQLMDSHGLTDWKFKFFENKNLTFGWCNYDVKTISLNKALTEVNEDIIVMDTLLHEIAHALAGRSNGHNDKWKNILRKIGGININRTYSSKNVVLPKLKYSLECPCCGYKTQKQRLSKGVACLMCCNKYNNGEWSEQYQYKVTKN